MSIFTSMKPVFALVILAALTACDSSGGFPAPTAPNAAISPAAESLQWGHGQWRYGVPMTREEARENGIRILRNALSLTRSGAPSTLGVSDGRTWVGEEAMVFLARKLSALESGALSSPSPIVYRSSTSSVSGTASADCSYGGFVNGYTTVFSLWNGVSISSGTEGLGADYTYLSTTIRVDVTGRQGSRTLFGGATAFGMGDAVFAEGSVHWYSHEDKQFGLASSFHAAGYNVYSACEYEATTTSYAFL